MANKKSWKDHLLSSGLPLEQSVIQILEELGIQGPTEYKYERNNELGIPTVFSVDVYAPQTYHELERQWLWLNIFCECKYRHDSVRWLFTPYEFGRWPRARSQDVFIILDQLTGPKVVNTEHFSHFVRKYKLCNKGIEILENDANNKTIDQCIQQLRYGMINDVVDSLVHQVDKLLGPISPIFILLPIIITTAELWRIRPGTTIQNIREANELDQIGHKLNSLIIFEPPDNLFSQYTLAKLNKSLSDDQKSTIDKRMRKIGLYGYNYFLSYFSSKHPSFFMVVNYKYFRSMMKSLLSFFGDSSLMKRRTRPRPFSEVLNNLHAQE